MMTAVLLITWFCLLFFSFKGAELVLVKSGNL